MAELKTKLNESSVTAFLDSIEDPQKRMDSYRVLELMKGITGEEPKMWGNSIVGFGSYHYRYENGREGDWFLTGFSPRKQNISLYIMSGFSNYDELMKGLGKYKTGKACLYVNKLDDVHENVLKDLISQSVAYISNRYR